jgi:hypothetical protein
LFIQGRRKLEPGGGGKPEMVRGVDFLFMGAGG